MLVTNGPISQPSPAGIVQPHLGQADVAIECNAGVRLKIRRMARRETRQPRSCTQQRECGMPFNFHNHPKGRHQVIHEVMRERSGNRLT
jgi:hypothetical protein